MTVELRGFVAKNGRGEWCFFPYAGADGVVLPPFLVDMLDDAAPRHTEVEGLPGPRCTETSPTGIRCQREHAHEGVHHYRSQPG